MKRIQWNIYLIFTLLLVQSLQAQNNDFIESIISRKKKKDLIYLNERPIQIDFETLDASIYIDEAVMGFQLDNPLDSLEENYDTLKDSLWVEDVNISGFYVIPQDSCRQIIKDAFIVYINENWSARKEKRVIRKYKKKNKKWVYSYSFPLWLNKETCVIQYQYSCGQLIGGGCTIYYQWNASEKTWKKLGTINCFKI